MDYRALPCTSELKQAIRLGSADATVEVPRFLLPHHEHLLPPIPTLSEIIGKGEGIRDADGRVEELLKERECDILEANECTIRIGAHARSPAVMDQELLDWVARVVKASKVSSSYWLEKCVRSRYLRDTSAVLVLVLILIFHTQVMEMEKENSSMDEEVHGFRDFVGAVKGGMRNVCILLPHPWVITW